jgi:hypothetical protein
MLCTGLSCLELSYPDVGVSLTGRVASDFRNHHYEIELIASDEVFSRPMGLKSSRDIISRRFYRGPLKTIEGLPSKLTGPMV